MQVFPHLPLAAANSAGGKTGRPGLAVSGSTRKGSVKRTDAGVRQTFSPQA